MSKVPVKSGDAVPVVYAHIDNSPLLGARKTTVNKRDKNSGSADTKNRAADPMLTNCTKNATDAWASRTEQYIVCSLIGPRRYSGIKEP